jgi:hypothetical protein
MVTNGRRPGRKSAAALATPAVFPVTIPRLPPPPELDFEQKEFWALITSAVPADWFSAAAVPLLMQLCRHCTQARRLGELLERVAGNRKTELSYYESLLRLQRAESAAIGSLSTKLRLSPSTLRNDRGHLQHSKPGPAPWEDPLIGGHAVRR